MHTFRANNANVDGKFFSYNIINTYLNYLLDDIPTPLGNNFVVKYSTAGLPI